MDRSALHTLTVEFGSADHTRTLLSFAADLHRRQIAITALSFSVRNPARVRIEAQFTASPRQARTAQRTMDGKVDVLHTALTTSP
ncbi:hypothetical protein M2272_005041 [Mycobacterium frederiksbergense]|uniref:ACT domain-containing protein n=1 Tax=Mycolicibacterium frederiksbergense TaxID=117567 RepID=A0ABT6L613_9MYCO|nr:hypothetical protein [Mycolicibacterium frederiksbergense]MDH6198382.1 hypothetical protein [Mycolicibacterium frederiksbergense]